MQEEVRAYPEGCIGAAEAAAAMFWPLHTLPEWMYNKSDNPGCND